MDQKIARIPEDDAASGDEASLVSRLRDGDEVAYEVLVRRYAPRMLATARRLLNDEAAAEDCMQEAFLNAFRSIDRFEERSSLSTWLHRITVNAALVRLRTRKRLGEQSIDGLMPEFDQNDCRIEPNWHFRETTEESLQRRQVRDLVIAKISELPETYRIVLMLRDIEELSTAEVAALLETTDGAVKIRLHRARAALKKLLEPIWKDTGA